MKKYIFMSDNSEGGGIAFNITSIEYDYRKKALNTEIIFLNQFDLKKLFSYENIFKKSIYVYITSVKTLYYALIFTFLRKLMFRKTIISSIIYHPRFADSNVSTFRKGVNLLLRLFPFENLRFYSKEALSASKIKNTTVSSLIGLQSDILNIKEEELKPNISRFLNTNKKEIIISTIGRFVDFKFGYLKSLIEYVNEKSNLKLIIIGFGPNEKALKSLVKKNNRIFFTGKLTLGESKTILNKSDLYIGMGTTLVDAYSLKIKSIIAIESNDKGVVSGFYGKGNNYSYGEYSSNEVYYQLEDFMNDFFDGKINVQDQNMSNDLPSERLLNLENNSKNILFCNLIYMYFIIIGLSIFRKIIGKDDYQ